MERVYHISDLGMDGLTWDWYKLELNKKYFISCEDMPLESMVWFISEAKIRIQAAKLNADILTWQDSIKCGWYLSLVQKKIEL